MCLLAVGSKHCGWTFPHRSSLSLLRSGSIIIGSPAVSPQRAPQRSSQIAAAASAFSSWSSSSSTTVSVSYFTFGKLGTNIIYNEVSNHSFCVSKGTRLYHSKRKEEPPDQDSQKNKNNNKISHNMTVPSSSATTSDHNNTNTTKMLPSTQALVGRDPATQELRSIFLYDGGCGVCKFSVGFCLERRPVISTTLTNGGNTSTTTTRTDPLRFVPLQAPLAQRLCDEYNMPCDLSTGILIDHDGAHRDSTSILRMLCRLRAPWSWIGWWAMVLVPRFIRDFCYQAFARNRGTIWKTVKRVTGMGDTPMHSYQTPYIMGLEEVPRPWPDRWGLHRQEETSSENKDSPGYDKKKE